MQEEIKIPEWDVEVEIESSDKKINEEEFIDYLMDSLTEHELHPSLSYRMEPLSVICIRITLQDMDILSAGSRGSITIRHFMRKYGITNSTVTRLQISRVMP